MLDERTKEPISLHIKIHDITMPAALMEASGLQHVTLEIWETALQQKKVQQVQPAGTGPGM